MLFDNSNLLSNEEIRERLIHDGCSSEFTDSIIQQFWFHDWENSFISIPAHFQILRQFLAKEKPVVFSRFDFYTFFYFRTISNYEKLSESLPKIGVVFELMQTDRMSVEELEEILKELKITKEIPLKLLLETNLITISQEEEKKIAKWNHHTLTEYLSAVYILRQKELIETIDKFMCNSESKLTTFIPSWTGTLRFIIEKTPEKLIDWLSKNFKTNPNFLNDQLAEVIVFSTPASISEGYRIKLFHLIYDFYQGKKWWIPVWAYHDLYKFINKGVYKELRKNSKNESYEIRGNIAAIIDGLLRSNKSAITTGERSFWRRVLIEYAKDENTNGVLQRHSLAALENFTGDISIIREVAKNFQSQDSLVREAFINLCKAIDPNSPISIDFFIKGISEDTVHIYARNALYEISSGSGIKNLLKGIVENERFISQFLDKESIFNKDGKQADAVLLNNIKKNLDAEIIKLIKKLILNIFTKSKNYNAGNSYFLQQLGLIVKSEESTYLEEIISNIKVLTDEEKANLFINDFEGILSVLLDVNHLTEFKEIFSNLNPHSAYALAEAIRLAPKNGNPNGEEVLKRGIELGITADPEKLPKYNDHLKERELEIYKEFRKYLSPPTKGQYYPQVFGFFIANQKIIEAQMNDFEKNRLIKLAIEEILNKTEPQKIKVRYKNQKTKTGEYTISSIAAYFPDALRLIHKFKPQILKLPKNRRKVINFTPFAYNDDFKIIQDILGEVTDKELVTVNKIMMDEKNDVRYLIPQTYIYFSEKFINLKSPRNVLLSFIKDKLINESDKVYALNTLINYISSDDIYVEKLLLTAWNPKERNTLSDTANALLISIFGNDKAILWRFKTIINSVTPFQRQEGAHSVGELEMELDYLAFATPLINLKDEKYLSRFVDLLNFSLNLENDEKFRAYRDYLWRIAIAFVVRENFFLSETAYKTLKTWVERNKENPDINWFNKRLEIALTEYKQTRKKKISEAINAIIHE